MIKMRLKILERMAVLMVEGPISLVEKRPKRKSKPQFVVLIL
jgi:hypothetical protein